LGASVVGKSATELISEATIAVREELTISDIKQTVHAHPTLSEIWYEAVK
jgi:dihydrolipoamide dehydrogenase